MSNEKYFALVLNKAMEEHFSQQSRRNFSALVKAAQEDAEKEEPPDKSSDKEPPKGESKEVTRTEGETPRSVYGVIKLFGKEGATFNEIIKTYAQAAGQKPRRVNRTSIRYSLDRMVQSGKIKAFNRSDGQTVYVAGGGKDAEGSK
jgi:hypothetical protein